VSLSTDPLAVLPGAAPMKKPESLRQHLLASVPTLARDPERLLIFIDTGKIRCTAAPGLSFEYEYTLNVILTDYAGSPDVIMVPLLAWLRVHQPELLLNLEKSSEGIRFEADILDKHKVDLSMTLPLSERVIVKILDGELHIEHADEPPMIADAFEAQSWQLYVGGELVVAWNNPQ
jgi:hypothetical protein